jgi:hypothetical protein
MDSIKLPQHVVNRIERRWATKFAQTPAGRLFWSADVHRHRTEACIAEQQRRVRQQQDGRQRKFTGTILSDRRKSGIRWKGLLRPPAADGAFP